MSDAPEMIDALKPCPFCGGNQIQAGHVRDGRCIGCILCGSVVRAYHPNAESNAREKWNTRADLPPTPAQIMAEPRVKALVEAAQNAAIALSEAEDKFHVLSFYINDDASLKCAKERVEWMLAAKATITTALAPFKEPEHGQN